MECKHWETAGEEKDALWFCGGVGVEGDKERRREEIAVDRVVEVVDPLETNDHVCSVVMIILVQ